MKIFDETPCVLGEGPLWHPERKQLFWFDILKHRLHTKGRHWQFDEGDGQIDPVVLARLATRLPVPDQPPAPLYLRAPDAAKAKPSPFVGLSLG